MTLTSRETLKQAFTIDWIQDEVTWLQMLRDRNETSYVYDEEKAKQIYDNIVRYFPVMNSTFEKLKKRFEEQRGDTKNVSISATADMLTFNHSKTILHA